MLKRFFVVILLSLLPVPALAGTVEVTIDLSDQKMVVREDGWFRYRWDISTARPGYRTPIGTFHPIRMYETYYSIKYDFAPMPWSIFFYGGYAIHGTYEIASLGSPVSHGCVRLHPDNAHILFDMVNDHGKQNTTIQVQQ